MHFDIDPDVARARTLPARFYLDTEAFALARERLFARSWQWLGDLGDVREAGCLSPRTLLPGLLDEPLLLARDAAGAAAGSVDAGGGRRAGTLRCLSNVCTHRGNLLVPTPCTGAAGIRCSYHSRRFDLAGRMTFMPGFEGAADFPSPADDLPHVPFGAWHGQGFAALAPAIPLADVLGPIEKRLTGTGVLPPSGDGETVTWPHDPAHDRSFEFDAHWALYVENYLEGLHIPFVHPGLARAIDFAEYRYELFPWCNLQLALARPGEAAFPPAAAGHAGAGLAVAACYFWVWPNLMLNFYPWGLSVNLVQPLAPARTRVLFRSYVRDAALRHAGAGGALDTVEQEDEAVVLTVQQGIRSRLYERGRYSPRHERGVHQFHRLVAQAMAG
ncbi:MAG: Rieske 2Fe-2S domain-containing protein [Rubrivivax sp.]|nr:Rieske 2Fe-2S domain-containing protein [Rubrivivax sp.]